MEKRYTIFIARGPNAACADFWALSLPQALVDASVMWREPIQNLECAGLLDPQVYTADVAEMMLS